MTRPTAETLSVWTCAHCGAVNTAGRKNCGTCAVWRDKPTTASHGSVDTRQRIADGIACLRRVATPKPEKTGNAGETYSAVQNVQKSKFGRCPYTSRPYRSKTEARWAAEQPQHRYEQVGIRTACGVYWPDFACDMDEYRDDAQRLYEVKGAYIRDRALHKVKAAIRPARALGFAGIWLAIWDGKRWLVDELQEG